MGSKSLAKMVKQVFCNEALKEQFLSDPNGVIARFNITKQEKEAVLGAHGSLGNSPEAVMMIDPMIMWP